MFSEQELAFLRTQPLASLATVAITGQPDAGAVGFAL
ncbi:pyridoxamine 5'-phosphate oxidase family protein [Ktedonobacter sp. SOSP1-52]